MNNNASLNIDEIRSEFPMLQTEINGKQIIYLDSAATTQKPRCVIDRITKFYLEEYAKPKESHYLSKQATIFLEDSRKKWQHL